MTDRLVKVLEQGKLILRGLKRDGSNAVLSLDSDETLDLNFDWSDWLGSDTISSVTNNVTGVSVTSETNDTTTASMNVSATYSGLIEHRVTTDGGLTKEMKVFVSVDGFAISDDYGIAWPL